MIPTLRSSPSAPTFQSYLRICLTFESHTTPTLQMDSFTQIVITADSYSSSGAVKNDGFNLFAYAHGSGTPPMCTIG